MNLITSIYVCVLISHRPLSLGLFINHNNLSDIYFVLFHQTNNDMNRKTNLTRGLIQMKHEVRAFE